MDQVVTTEQLRKVVQAFGAAESFPEYTDDPFINYLVDCVLQDEEEVAEYDEAFYVKEIAEVKAL